MIRKFLGLMLLAGLLTGCQREVATEPFEVKGDIETWTIIEDTTKPLDTMELINALTPLYGTFDLVISSRDGFSIRLSGDTIDNTSLKYSPSTGWMFVSEHHPVNSRVKWISEVIVVKKKQEEPNFSAGLNIIRDDQNIHKSLGELLSMEYGMRFHIDGTTEQEGNSIDVMKKVRFFPLKTWIEEDYDWLLVMDGSGEHHYIREGDYSIEMQNRQLNLRGVHGQEIEDVVGVIVDPPAQTVMDNYYDAMNYIEKGIPVLTIFIDGFAFEQWEQVKEEYPSLYISKQKFSKASTVYTPVTNAGFAAMISGQVPKQTGIMDRSVRRPACDTIYNQVEEGVLIDGLVKILDVPCKLYLENDEDDDGYTDEEVYVKALDIPSEKYMLVHFNGVDEAGHDYGPYDEKTINKIIEVDGYVEELANRWPGKVIILADHGMHKTSEGGDHGEFRVEDMFIPYLIIDGGQYE